MIIIVQIFQNNIAGSSNNIYLKFNDNPATLLYSYKNFNL
jgi:hypothetical protein